MKPQPRQIAPRPLVYALALAVALPLGGSFAVGCGDQSEEGSPYYTGAPVEPQPPTQSGETYKEWEENDWVETATEQTSTFSIDVDTGSYTLMRRDIQDGTLPVPEGVRPEEYINFFDYDYPEPEDGAPFSIQMEIAPSHFGEGKDLLRIGLNGRSITKEEIKPSNLVFLVDVSGSMSNTDKLPLVKQSLHILLDNLRPSDTVGLVTYADGVREVLQPTEVRERAAIEAAIDSLSAGGSTNGEAGIVRAYAMADAARIEGGNNRIFIATDGDFNVGRYGEELETLVESYRDEHITLTAAGFGSGNYNDGIVEAFARKTNGNYVYVDNVDEAQRVFGTNLASTLEVIAADVKIQVAFDPVTVRRYRLVGYENRVLENDDFDDDTVDAGEIGAGHTVTALYEVEIDREAPSETGLLAEVRLRHKAQFGAESEEQTEQIKLSQAQASFDGASADFRFAAAVAEFAEILRGSMHSEGERFDEVEAIATAANPGADPYRDEFVTLVELAAGL